MKVDSDLRAAIKAAEKTQAARRISRYQIDEENKRKAIDSFFKSRSAKANHAKIIGTRMIELRAQLDKLHHELVGYGLRLDCNSLYQIDDEKRFKKAGGTVPSEPEEPWIADRVIAVLAAAQPSQRIVILKKYGINWE